MHPAPSLLEAPPKTSPSDEPTRATSVPYQQQHSPSPQQSSEHEGAVKRPRLEDTADEDEDDLDVPARSRSSPQRMAELTSSRPKATGFQAATLSPGHAKSAPAKSAAKGDNATVETMAPKKVENTNDQRDSDSEEDDIFTRFKSRQTSDRRRRPVAQRKAEGKGDTKGDIIPSFMS